MRSPLRAAAVLGATLALFAVGTGSAHAIDLPGLFEAAVSLDHAPRANQVVSGVQAVTGSAEATEGVLNVKMYVVQHGAETVADAEPVAARYYDFPATPAEFAFDWDAGKTAAGTYDLVVIAATATREARTEVLGLRVVKGTFTKALPQKKSKPQSGKSSPAVRPAGPARDASTVTALSHSTGIAAKTRVTKRQPVSVGRLGSQVPRGVQTEAFYQTYGALPYAAEASAAVLPAGLRVGNARDGAGGLWPSLAASMVLLLTAAHIQRVLRQQALFTR